MNISYNWLKNYLDLNLPAEEISQLLTDTGLEVEGIKEIESVKGGLKGVVIGEVITKTQHPNADRLSITTVDIGEDEGNKDHATNFITIHSITMYINLIKWRSGYLYIV